MYIAHINENDGSIQSVSEHCLTTARLAEQYSVEQLKRVVFAMGVLHDIGKYQSSFQKKITLNKNIRVEHSTCGAIAAKEKYSYPLSLIMQYCIAGHHSGIPDGGSYDHTDDMPTLYGRLRRSFEDYSAYKSELDLPDIDENKFNNFLVQGCNSQKDLVEKFSFLTRYCFSCLTDADSNDTADFCNGQSDRELVSDFEQCLKRINHRLSSFSCTTELQKTRSLIQQQVYSKTNIDSEIYLMNMPTGSGKTLCSMKFALERALKTGKRRIIYVIPYNSIIDQTAEQFEDLFGNDAQILRHQSTFSYDDLDIDEDYRNVMRHAAENWNAQIIITTAVQFFESVYANKRGKLRKMHNMSNSIIVFDEAHLMPVEYLQPCLRVISYITRILNSEAVFLTATMPDFHKLITEYSLSDSKITNLIDDTSLFEKFNKCSFVNIGTLSKENLIAKSYNNPSTLIVVNHRSTAREIYSLCSGKKYHLSTYMTAFDRKNTINKIKTELSNLERDYPELKNVPDDRKITVVSTSLIEAGVDLDFYCVFRELSGLDSILQAGGRCNREGKRKNANVFIFSLDSEKRSVSSDDRANISKGLITEYSDIACPESIRDYYDRLFFINKESITKKSISEQCSNIESIPFSKYADEFELIDDNTFSVVVERDDESKQLIENIKATSFGNHRKLQKYAFSVKRNEFESLLKQHVIDDYKSGIWCLKNSKYYDENTGITFEAQDYYLD